MSNLKKNNMKQFLLLMSLIVMTTFSATAMPTIEGTKFFGETKFTMVTHFVPVTLTVELTRYVTVDKYSIPITKFSEAYKNEIGTSIIIYSIPITKFSEAYEDTKVIKIPKYTKSKRKFNSLDGFNYKKHYRKSKRTKRLARLFHRSVGCRN